MEDEVRNDLNNFPDEVIDDWILPLTERNGWPPNNINWHAILLRKDLNFWQQTNWRQQETNLVEILWSAETLNIINDMQAAYAQNQNNIFQETLGNEGRARYMAALKFIFEHGTFPKPIILLEEGGGYSIADGHHRFLAWKMSHTFIDLLNRMDGTHQQEAADQFRETLLRRWGVEMIADFSPNQTIWIASSEA